MDLNDWMLDLMSRKEKPTDEELEEEFQKQAEEDEMTLGSMDRF